MFRSDQTQSDLEEFEGDGWVGSLHGCSGRRAAYDGLLGVGLPGRGFLGRRAGFGGRVRVGFLLEGRGRLVRKRNRWSVVLSNMCNREA